MIIVSFVIPMNEIARNNLKDYNSSVNLTLNISGKLVLKPLTKLVHSFRIGNWNNPLAIIPESTDVERVRVIPSNRLKYSV